MRFRETGPHVVRLLPGDLAVADRPSLLVTILGSCIAVTLWDVRTHRAAMCHAVLPEPGPREDDGGPARYVEPAIVSLLDDFRRAGARRAELEVKLFGGGEVLAVSEGALRRVPSVGALNVRKAREVLGREGLPLAAEDVGGVRGRKILFNTRTGEVFLKRLAEPRGSGGGSAAPGRRARRREP